MPGFVTVARRGSCGVVPAYICKHLIGFKVLKPGTAVAPNQLMPRLQAPCTSGLPGHICLCDRRWRLSTDSLPKAMPCCGTRLPAGPHAGEAVLEVGRPRLSDIQLVRSSGNVALMPPDGVRQRVCLHA